MDLCKRRGAIKIYWVYASEHGRLESIRVHATSPDPAMAPAKGPKPPKYLYPRIWHAMHMAHMRFSTSGGSPSDVMVKAGNPARLDYIDVAKGLGIVLVVIGHIWPGTLKLFIFCFHMPLFFVLSGFLFKPSAPGAYLSRKAVHLLVPYAASLALLVLIAPKPHLETLLDSAEYSHPLLMVLYGGQHLVTYAGTFWFLSCLWFTQQLLNLQLRWSSVRALPWIALGCYLLSLADQHWLGRPFPWALNVSLAVIPFFVFGYLIRTIRSTPVWSLVLSGAILAAGYVLVAKMGYSASLNLKNTFYGIPFVSLLIALAGAWFILGVSRLVATFRGVSSLFQLLGSASLFILLFHQFINLRVSYTRFADNLPLRAVLALGIPLVVFVVGRRFSLFRALFLGSNHDFALWRNRAVHLLRRA